MRCASMSESVMEPSAGMGETFPAHKKAVSDADGRDVVIDAHGCFPFRLTNGQGIDYTRRGIG